MYIVYWWNFGTKKYDFNDLFDTEEGAKYKTAHINSQGMRAMYEHHKCLTAQQIKDIFKNLYVEVEAIEYEDTDESGAWNTYYIVTNYSHTNEEGYRKADTL